MFVVTFTTFPSFVVATVLPSIEALVKVYPAGIVYPVLVPSILVSTSPFVTSCVPTNGVLTPSTRTSTVTLPVLTTGVGIGSGVPPWTNVTTIWSVAVGLLGVEPVTTTSPVLGFTVNPLVNFLPLTVTSVIWWVFSIPVVTTTVAPPDVTLAPVIDCSLGIWWPSTI